MYNRSFTPERITELKPNEIFVFGSNLAGSHGGGAARLAYNRFGAIWGQGVGLQGQSYAIPTMQGGVETIKPYVDEFVAFAVQHPEIKFFVTRIGCGIAGFRDEQIAPLFKKALDVENVILPQEFVEVIQPAKKVATEKSWHTEPMPEQHVVLNLDATISSDDMQMVKKGHIPEAMEDHWFMYCDDTTIRYFRSWSGYCIFIAKYVDDGVQCRLTELTVNRDPEQCKLSDDEHDKKQFMKLLASEYRR